MRKSKFLLIALAALCCLTSCEYHNPSERELNRIQKQWCIDFIDGYTYMFDIGVTSPGECIRTIRRDDNIFHEKDRYIFDFQMRKGGQGGKLTATGIGDAELENLTMEFTDLKEKSAHVTFLFGGVLPVIGNVYTVDTLIVIHK